MLILAFDTTNEQGGAAIYRDSECLVSSENQAGTDYSVTLFRAVDHMLAKVNLKLAEIDLFAVAAGPGSFTGIRVGVAAAQGWAQATGRPVCGVSVLAAMVEEARPPADWAVPVLDARRGEFILGVFRRRVAADADIEREGKTVEGHFSLWDGLDGTEDGSSRIRDPGVAREHGWLLKRSSVRPFLERLTDGGQAVDCLVRERDASAQALRELLPDGARWQTVGGPLMGAIARLALIAYRSGKFQSPGELDALYIRRSDAEMHWTES